MSIYIIQSENDTIVADRNDFINYLKNKDKIATSSLCKECKIFNHEQKKCTHPAFGCESNLLRVKPWENGLICPKKVKP